MTAIERDCVVVHPGVQHSALCAAALDQAGRLMYLITRLQIGANPPFPWNQADRWKALSRTIQLRQAPYLDDSFILRKQVGIEFAERALRRLNAHEPAARLSSILQNRFQSAAAKMVLSGVTNVIGTDHGSHRLFSELAQRGASTCRILDVSHPLPRLVQRLVREDADHLSLPLDSYDDYVQSPQFGNTHEELHMADRILVASSFSAQSVYEEGIPRERVRIVPYGFPISGISVEHGPPDPLLKLVFVGALTERKGVTTLLRAMNETEKRGVPVHLEIIGSGSPSETVRPPINVTMLGKVSHHEVRAALARAHYLVLPSMCEGFGRVLIEALASGTGVITTDRSAGPDIQVAHPSAPVEIIPVGERDLLPDLFARLRDEVAARGIDRPAAQRAGASYNLNRYGEHLAAALAPRQRDLPDAGH